MMTLEQTGAILAAMSAYDDRNVDPPAVLAWHEIIGHLDFDACRQAVITFYREHADRRAMPADIRRLATDIQARQRAALERHARQRQIAAGRKEPPRTGAAMVQYVLGRLRDAGSDPANGVRLGPEKAAAVAERACREWLDATKDIP